MWRITELLLTIFLGVSISVFIIYILTIETWHPKFIKTGKKQEEKNKKNTPD